MAANRLKANRRNAALSTGPTSAAGRAVASQNSVRHGLYARLTLISGGPLAESADEADAFIRAIVGALQPKGALETELAERAASLLWRLRRAPRAEAVLIERAPLAPREQDEGVPQSTIVVMPAWAWKGDYKLPVSCQCQTGRDDVAIPPATGRADLVHRAESHLSREFARTLAMLDAVQCRRRDKESITVQAP